MLLGVQDGCSSLSRPTLVQLVAGFWFLFLVLSVLREKTARTQFCVDWSIALGAVATLGYTPFWILACTTKAQMSPQTAGDSTVPCALEGTSGGWRRPSLSLLRPSVLISPSHHRSLCLCCLSFPLGTWVI